MQSKWKSPVLWTSLVSVVLYTGAVLLKLDVSDPTLLRAVTIVVGLLASFGIINNPTSKNTL